VEQKQAKANKIMSNEKAQPKQSDKRKDDENPFIQGTGNIQLCSKGR
jgi:hypothetical protein